MITLRFPHVDRSRVALVLGGLNALLLAGLLFDGRRASAAAVPDTLRARAIELVDDSGRVRVQLNVEPSGEAVLRLRDGSGQVRVKLGADRDGSGLLLLDGATEPAIHMLARTGGTTLTLAATDGARRVLTP
jgi:hypothetical protein